MVTTPGFCSGNHSKSRFGNSEPGSPDTAGENAVSTKTAADAPYTHHNNPVLVKPRQAIVYRSTGKTVEAESVTPRPTIAMTFHRSASTDSAIPATPMPRTPRRAITTSRRSRDARSRRVRASPAWAGAEPAARVTPATAALAHDVLARTRLLRASRERREVVI